MTTKTQHQIFRIITFAFPLFVLLLVECGLRLFHYDGNLDLVIRKTLRGREYYAINRNVARRYFAQPGVGVPEPAEDIFEITKSPKTIRIFCLGESTMAGFPYEFNATAPSLLKDRLKALFPNRNIEVINAGLAAVGSYIVDDFAQELLSYEPDLIIVYVGHNEFYGVYGGGSAIRIPGGQWSTRLTIRLTKSKTFLLLRDGYNWIRTAFRGPTSAVDADLMEQVVGNHDIPYRSNLYNATREAFRNNIERFVRRARLSGVPVVVSTLVSNVRDQPPFVSRFANSASDAQRKICTDLMQRGDTAFSEKNYGAATRTYRSVIEVDSVYPLGFFRLGKALYADGRYSEARQAFTRAKDLDELRFRASEDFQHDLMVLAGEQGVYVSRVDSAFVVAAQNGIPGHELFLEHLHPNLEGYFLMAKTWCATILNSGVLKDVPEAGLESKISDSACLELAAVTSFDSLEGAIKTAQLTHRWPFTHDAVPYSFKPTGVDEAIVDRYVRGGLAWSDARYQMADYFERTKAYEKARRECVAVAKVIPMAYQPLLRIGDLFVAEGKRKEASEAYRVCYRTEDNPFARLKRAVLLMQENAPDIAIGEADSALMLNTRAGRDVLTTPQKSMASYLLAAAYFRLGKIDLARQSVEHALALKPDYEPAKELLRQLPP